MKKGTYIAIIVLLIISAIAVSEFDAIKNYLKKDNQQEVKENQQETHEEVKPLDLSKCINNPSDGKEYIYSMEESIVLKNLYNNNEIKINSDKKSVTVITGKMKECIAETTNPQEVSENPIKLTISGFKSNIKQAILDITGNAGIPSKILFLLENGTIQYIDIKYSANYFEENNIRYYINAISQPSQIKTISNVSGAVALYNANVYVTGDIDGISTSIAVKKDGSFYDLKEVLFKEN